jgi:hypothetical protein
MAISFGIVAGCAMAAIVLAYAYFRRCTVTRPPIGVMNRVDVFIIAATIILIPFVYLALPLWAISLIVMPSGLAIVYLTLEPLLKHRPLIWLCSLLLVSADLAAAAVYGSGTGVFLAVNDLLVVVIVIGVSNLWVQSGMTARHVTMLAAIVTLYDVIATSALPLMSDLLGRLSRIPLAPFVAWNGSGPGLDLALGFGDLLMAATFALAIRKAYGHRAGATAVALALSGIVIALGLVQYQVVGRVIPVMVILGPLMVMQYLTWGRRRGAERTMLQYRTAERLAGQPPRRSATTVSDLLVPTIQMTGGEKK